MIKDSMSVHRIGIVSPEHNRALPGGLGFYTGAAKPKVLQSTLQSSSIES